MPQQRILITGANGFVGQRLCKHLLEQNYLIRAIVRSAEKGMELAKQIANPTSFECQIISDIDETTNWNSALDNVDAIVHLAARVHVMNDTAQDPLAEFRRVNVAGTKCLAKAAIKKDVKKFIFLSSIKVNGETTDNLPQKKFTADDVPMPQDPYGVSKWEAEQFLSSLQYDDLQTIILRPPLIYGYGVKGNFEKLIAAVEKNKLLPLGNIHNQRSMLYVENLCDAIHLCLTNDTGQNQTYLISDEPPVSTTNLIEFIAAAKNKKARLISLPKKLLYLIAKAVNKTAALDRLFGSLIIDNSKIKKELSWAPKFTMQAALKRDFGSNI